MPRAILRRIIFSSFHRLTFRAMRRSEPFMFSIALVVAKVRRSEAGRFSRRTVSVSSSPSRRLAAALSSPFESSHGSVHCDAQSDQHRVSRELDAIDEHCDQVDVVELAPTLATGSNARVWQRHMAAAEGDRCRARTPVVVRAPFDVLASPPMEVVSLPGSVTVGAKNGPRRRAAR
jgi:hypothetical protein